jgi:hypothetical protein
MRQVARLERQYAHMVRLCLHCGGGGGRVVPLSAGHSTSPGPHLLAALAGGPAGRRAAGVAARPACEVNCYNAGCGGVVCDSLDCGVYYERRKLLGELAVLARLLQDVRRQLELSV